MHILILRFIFKLLTCSLPLIFQITSLGQVKKYNLLDSVILSNSYTLKLDKESLTGNAVPFLLKEIENTQFVILGEEHNIAEIPLFTEKLFMLIHDKFGFNYFATEQDPVMIEKISMKPYRGNLDSINKLAVRYLKGFTFISDEELEMLAGIGKKSTAKYKPIWGCEQAFGVTHILDELKKNAKTKEQHNAIRLFQVESFEKERERDLARHHYMAEAGKKGKIDSLKKAFLSSNNKRTDYLIEAIEMSDSIYSLFKKSEQGDPGERYYNNLVREQYMKKLFSWNYNAAYAKEKKAPKVLFKYGQLHLYKGLNPLNILSLGNFISEFANSSGTSSFSIYMQVHRDTSSKAAIKDFANLAFLLPFANLSATNNWTLIDLRPLRPFYRIGALNDLIDKNQILNFRTLIFGYDCLLLFGNGKRATFSIANVPY